MLVLGRKPGESLVIADEIVITILAVERDQVKLGIDAPRQIPVMRQELYEAVREQNLIAASLPDEVRTKGLEALRAFLVEQTTSQKEPPQESPKH